MSPPISAPRDQLAPRTSLVRILGLGFGLAVIFGGIAGGCYALLGANSVAELGAAMPQAGGFYVYSRRAFGNGVGFAVGWADWLSNCAVIAYASVTAAEYIVALVPALASRQTLIALGLLVLFCSLQAAGLRLSSSIQKLTSSITAITFLSLAAACLLHGAQATAALPPQGFRNTSMIAMLVPVVAALRAIVVAYDGWYEAIYFTEEDTNAQKNLPRAMIGGVLIVTALYLLMNLAFLHVLSMQ